MRPVVTGNPVAAPGWYFMVSSMSASSRSFSCRCSVFAMPAFKEPLGLVFLEAMGSNIRDGMTGCLVPPGDSRALAERLMGLLADLVATRAMGERGYADAKQYWNCEAVVGRMLGTMRG